MSTPTDDALSRLPTDLIAALAAPHGRLLAEPLPTSGMPHPARDAALQQMARYAEAPASDPARQIARMARRVRRISMMTLDEILRGHVARRSRRRPPRVRTGA